MALLCCLVSHIIVRSGKPYISPIDDEEANLVAAGTAGASSVGGGAAARKDG